MMSTGRHHHLLHLRMQVALLPSLSRCTDLLTFSIEGTSSAQMRETKLGISNVGICNIPSHTLQNIILSSNISQTMCSLELGCNSQPPQAFHQHLFNGLPSTTRRFWRCANNCPLWNCLRDLRCLYIGSSLTCLKHS